MNSAEIRNSYKQFVNEVNELSKNILTVAHDKRRLSELPLLSAQFQQTLQSKTVETWVEIAAQLADLNNNLIWFQENWEVCGKGPIDV